MTLTQSDTDYLPILKTLCAYVRENATFQEEPTDEDGDPLPELPDLPKGRDETAQELTERLGAIYLYANNLQSWGERLRQKAAARGEKSAQRPDIRAALDVLCERPKKGRLALGGIDSVYQRTLDLSETPEDRTTEARRCRLDLAAAALQGAARWGADLRWANLGEARMEGADLSEARMERAHLVNAQMQGAVLSRAQMQGADLFMARMEGARLVRAQMQGAVLTGARMQGAILIMVRMQAADLRFARMEGADLSGAWMERADLRFTHMEGANLSEARMQSADMDNADFRAAVVTSANFTDTKNLTYDQLASAFGDAATRLPPDLDAMRQRLIAEAGWAKDETPLLEIEQRYVAWRAQRSL